MSLMTNWLESLHLDVKLTSSCLRKKNQKSTCQRCIEICDEKAISLENLKVDSNQCTSCGKCVIECPISAIEGIPAKRQFEKNSLVYDNTYTPLVKELLIYKKKELSSIQIDQSSLNIAWKKILEETNNTLLYLNEQPLTIKVKEQRISRRDFFSSIQLHGKQMAKELAPAGWKIDCDGWKLSKYYPNIQFYEIKIDDQKCSMCRACFSVCPEGIFTLTNTKLMIENSKCVNCSLCMDICPENAIKISTDIKDKKDEEKACFNKVCPTCGKSFHSFHQETEKCYVCIDRDPSWLSP